MRVKARCLRENGIVEVEKGLSPPGHSEVQIKTLLVGLCGSDTAVYYGKEEYLGDDFWGHEGIGEVVTVGSDVNDIKPGDIVSSYWHPQFWERYNAPRQTVARVPEVAGKFILQPVACVLNAINGAVFEMSPGRVLVIGSGFMAMLFSRFMDLFQIDHDVLAYHNLDVSHRAVSEAYIEECGYECVILASTNNHYAIALRAVAIGGSLVHYATPRDSISTNFGEWNWKCVRALFPSPRNRFFHKAHERSVRFVDSLNFEEVLRSWPIEQVDEAFKAEANKKGIVKNYLVVS